MSETTGPSEGAAGDGDLEAPRQTGPLHGAALSSSSAAVQEKAPFRALPSRLNHVPEGNESDEEIRDTSSLGEHSAPVAQEISAADMPGCVPQNDGRSASEPVRPPSQTRISGLSKTKTRKDMSPLQHSSVNEAAERHEKPADNSKQEVKGACSWLIDASRVTGKGSVLQPLFHCLAEQVCLYDRETKHWCCHGKFKFLTAIRKWLYDGRWKWESWIIVAYFAFLGLEAIMAWQLLKSDRGNDNMRNWISEPSVSWGVSTMVYVALAIGGFVPTMHAVLKPGDYKKAGKPYAFHDQYEMIRKTCKRRVWECYGSPGDTAEPVNGQPTLDDIRKVSEEFAEQCVSVRGDVEGALVTWAKWAKQYRMYNMYVNITQVVTSIGIPLLSQLITCEGASQLMLTVVSTHAGIVLALEKALRSQEKFRAYRIAESSALDIWRRMVHMPWMFSDSGPDDDKDFQDVLKEEFTVFTTKMEEVRDFARKIETYAGSKETDEGAKKAGGGGNTLMHDSEGNGFLPFHAFRGRSAGGIYGQGGRNGNRPASRGPSAYQ
mmetsp:Transcript_22263/g.61761  ORF Transcript_22263/g.61761 Transcript_22263/m.61761 type:complete len:547 (+) Transcript_22263:332-1972(+)